MTAIVRSGFSDCGSNVGCLLTQKSLGSFSGLLEPHHSSHHITALPLSRQTRQFISISRLFTAHPYIGHLPPADEHPPVCQHHSPPLPTANSPAGPLLSCLQKRSSPSLNDPPQMPPGSLHLHDTPMKTQAKPITRGVADVVFLLLSLFCGSIPPAHSPCTQISFGRLSHSDKSLSNKSPNTQTG